MLYLCFGDWQGRKLLVIGTSSLVRVLESMSLLDAFNVHLNVPQLKPADMKQVNFY
jgi:vesicle-fusing ATPase